MQVRCLIFKENGVTIYHYAFNKEEFQANLCIDIKCERKINKITVTNFMNVKVIVSMQSNIFMIL